MPLRRLLALASLLLLAAGCGWLRPAPTPILPPEELYRLGEQSLDKRQYNEAREHFKKIVERHPNSSHAPRAASHSSAEASVMPAETPPATSTRPSSSTVAVWCLREVASEPAMHHFCSATTKRCASGVSTAA